MVKVVPMICRVVDLGSAKFLKIITDKIVGFNDPKSHETTLFFTYLALLALALSVNYGRT
jgi:hypothetical protein